MPKGLELTVDKKDEVNKVDVSKIDATKNEEHFAKVKAMVDSIKTKSGLNFDELCTNLNSTDTKLQGEAITKINGILHDQFTISERKGSDNKDYIGVAGLDETSDETKKNVFLFPKEKFQENFLSYLKELFKDCGGSDIELALKQADNDLDDLQSEVIGNMAKIETSPNTGTPTGTTPETSGKGFWASAQNFFTNGWKKFTSSFEKMSNSKIGWVAAIGKGGSQLFGGETGKGLQEAGTEMASAFNEIFGDEKSAPAATSTPTATEKKV